MPITINGSTGIAGVDGSASTPSVQGNDTNTGVFYPAADTVAISTGGTEAIRVNSSQNVGIGTSSPAGRLDVAVGGSAGRIVFQGSGTTNYISSFNSAVSGSLDLAINGATIQLFTGGVERARINSGGQLLIGMTSGLSSEVLSASGGGQYVGVFQQTVNTSGYHVLRCGLQQNGGNTSSYFLWGNTNNVGNWYLFGNGTTSFSSDERLKKNIETTRDGYLEDVAKLRVVKYNWRNDEDGKAKELGLIAQEVERVFPGLVQDDLEKVSPDDETVYKSLKQSVLPFILLKAIQELKAQNDELKARVEALETK